MTVGIIGNTQALGPGQLAVEIEGGQVAVGKDGEYAPSVGRCCRGGVTRAVVYLGRLCSTLRRAWDFLLPK